MDVCHLFHLSHDAYYVLFMIAKEPKREKVRESWTVFKMNDSQTAIDV